MKRVEPPRFTFKGVKIDNLNYADIRGIVDREIRNRGYLCLTDVGNVMAASADAGLRDAINNALISLCDGTPLAWFGWMIGCRRVERVSGVQLMHRLLGERNGCRHFLLGDTDETIARIKAKARRANPDVLIEGHSPPFKDFSDEDDREMLRVLHRAAPDIVWVSFGGAKQEKWARRNAPRLDHGLMVCVGAAFRYFVGDIREPPLIVQKLGLQWLCRTLESKNPLKVFKFRWGRYRRFLAALPGETIRGRRAVREFMNGEHRGEPGGADGPT